MFGIKRREFITLLAGAAATWSLAARAQQSGRPTRLGYLGAPLNNPPAIAQYQAFRAQLEELGFREGRNLTIDYLALDDPRGRSGGVDALAAEFDRGHGTRSVIAGGRRGERLYSDRYTRHQFRPAGTRLYPQSGAAGRQHHRLGLSAIGAGAEAG